MKHSPNSSRRPFAALAALALLTGAAPVAVMAQAQKPAAAPVDPEVRLKKIEAEVRALQRQVFPGGDQKYFAPEVTKDGTVSAPPAGTPATSPVTDLLTRLDSVEAQLSRLTAQNEEAGNRIAQLEAKVAALTPPPAPAPAAATDAATPAGAAAATPPATVAAPAPAPKPSLAIMDSPPPAKPAPAPVAAAPKPEVQLAAAAPAKAAPAKELAPAPAKPSAKRVAAVKAIEKPATDDPGDDEYSYGFRLWEAKFYPEAEQQLQLFLTKYPKHDRVGWARNLLGRAFLDDGKPREAAQWFLKNYQADRKGPRAADSLLLLAESMRQLGDSNRACIALGEFAAGYKAEAAGRLKAQYDATKGGVKCN